MNCTKHVLREISVRSSLTFGFFQRLSSTHHSSFMMPDWELLKRQPALINFELTCCFRCMCTSLCLKQYFSFPSCPWAMCRPAELRWRFLCSFITITFCLFRLLLCLHCVSHDFLNNIHGEVTQLCSSAPSRRKGGCGRVTFVQ